MRRESRSLQRAVSVLVSSVISSTFLFTSAAAGTTPQAGDPPPEVDAAAARIADNGKQSDGSGLAESNTEPGGDTSSEAAEAPDVEIRDDGREWILDRRVNRRYMIERVPKVDGTYRWLNEERVRLPGGVAFYVEKHDEQWFWIRLYEALPPRSDAPDAIARTAPATEAVPRDPYKADLEIVDRLRMESFDRGLPSAGQWRNGFDVADMNGDGELDIVFGPSRKGRPQPNVFLGDGQGGWRRWNARFPGLPYDYGDAVAADWNGDGHMDLAFGVHLRGILALISDGQGGFEPWTEGIEFDHPGRGGDATSFSSRAIEAIDWNGDGALDLLALGEGPKGMVTPRGGTAKRIGDARGFVVYLNQGDGSWQPQRIEEKPRDFGDSFAIGDWNGDGRPDLALVSHRYGNTAVLRESSEAPLLEQRALPELRPGVFLNAIEAADFDADGRQDLAIGYMSRESNVWRSGIDLFYGTEEGWRRRPVIWQQGRKEMSALDSGHLDGDPHLDLVALTEDGEVLVFLGDGEGFLNREQSPELPQLLAGCKGWHVRLVDLDRDGRDEVVAGFAGESATPPGVPMVYTQDPGCRNEGRVNVWRPVPLETEPPAGP